MRGCKQGVIAGVLALVGLAGWAGLANGSGTFKANILAALATPTPVSSKPPLVTIVELGTVEIPTYGRMKPIIEEIKKNYGWQVRCEFHDVRTKEGEPFGVQYQILAYPMQIFLDKNGKEYFRHLGYFSKEDIVKVLKKKGVQ